MTTEHKKLIILGSGPAGYAASIYAARAGLKPTLITGTEVGGQLTTTTEVENWPGDSDDLQGPELMDRMQKHALKFDVEIINDHIHETKLTDGIKTLTGNSLWTCDALIISTGASAKYLGIPSEEKFLGKGVSACATCDGFFYKDQEVAVVGGGNTAAEEALYLSRICSKVHLIHRRDELRASKIMADRALENEKIEPVWDSQVTEYLTDEDGEMRAVKVLNLKTDEEKELDLKCVFVAIGHVPNAQFLDGLVDTDENGYIIQVPGCTKTNVEGLFAAGDVADHVYRQAITAAGDGCKAALEAERYLAENE